MHTEYSLYLPPTVACYCQWVLCARALSLKPSTNAMVRTVTAVTKFNAGIKVVCVCVRVCVCVHVCMHACMHFYMYVCVCVLEWEWNLVFATAV